MFCVSKFKYFFRFLSISFPVLSMGWVGMLLDCNLYGQKEGNKILEKIEVKVLPNKNTLSLLKDLPVPLPASNPNGYTGMVISRSARPDSLWDFLKMVDSKESDYIRSIKTGFVAYKPNTIITAGEAFQDEEGHFIPSFYKFHLNKKNSDNPISPISSEVGIPIRKTFIYSQAGKGYSASLPRGAFAASKADLAYAVTFENIISESQLPTVRFSNKNVRRLLSGKGKFTQGQAVELYSQDLLGKYDLHGSALTYRSLQQTNRYGTLCLGGASPGDVSSEKIEEAGFIYGLPSALGSPLYVEEDPLGETKQRTGYASYMIAGVMIDSKAQDSLQDLEKGISERTQTYIRALLDIDKVNLQKLHESLGSFDNTASGGGAYLDKTSSVQASVPEVPVCIQGLRCERDSKDLKPILSWDSHPQGTLHLILRNTHPLFDFETSFIGEATEDHFKDETADVSKTYYYCIYTVCEIEGSEYISLPSSILSVKSPAQPLPPRELMSDPQNSYHITWQPPQGEFLYSLVYRIHVYSSSPAPNSEILIHLPQDATYSSDVYGTSFDLSLLDPTQEHFIGITTLQGPLQSEISNVIRIEKLKEERVANKSKISEFNLNLRKHAWRKDFIAWNPIPGERVQYHVFKLKGLEEKLDINTNLVAITSNTYFYQKGLESERPVYYQVLSFTEGENSIASEVVAFQAMPTIPEPPSGFSVANGLTQRLEWDPIPAFYGTYEVYRLNLDSRRQQSYTRIGSTVDTSFTDSEAKPDRLYKYYITAKNKFGESFSSKVLTIRFLDVN